MGQVASTVEKAVQKGARRVFGQREIRLLMVGLDASGKTTILYQLKLGEVVTTIPTIGMNVETVEKEGLSFTVWDVSTRSSLRPLWRHYFAGTLGVVYVFDGNDRCRVDDSIAELKKILQTLGEVEEGLAGPGAALAVLCNKRDLPDCMAGDEIAARLQASAGEDLRGRRWRVFETIATTGQGLERALEWLSDSIAGTLAMDAAAGQAVPLPPLPADLPPLVARAERGGAGGTEPAGAWLAQARTPDAKWGPDWPARVEAGNGRTDGELRADFEAGRLSYDSLPHPAMIRLLWIHLADWAKGGARLGQGRGKVVGALLDGLKAAHGRSGHVFHLTLAYFWLQLVDVAINAPVPPSGEEGERERAERLALEAANAREPHMAAFRSFLLANRFLVDEDLVAQFYSRGAIFHEPRSMSEFVLPDLKALPSVLSFSREALAGLPPRAR